MWQSELRWSVWNIEQMKICRAPWASATNGVVECDEMKFEVEYDRTSHQEHLQFDGAIQ
jgi:hypothetical protein